MKTATLLLVIAALSGCTSVSRSSETRLRVKDGNFTVDYRSAKDQKVDELEIDPQTKRVKITKLAAQVNQAAVEAASAARIADSAATSAIVTGALGLAQDALRARAGLPTAGIPAKAVKDDPSTTRFFLPGGQEIQPMQ